MNKRLAMSAAVAALALGMAHATTYTSASYVQVGLVAQWDGIDNVGTGIHDPTTNVWKDLVGDCDLTVAKSGTHAGSWCRGIGLSVYGPSAFGAKAAPKYKTIEVLCRIGNKGGRILFWSGIDSAHYVLFDHKLTDPYCAAYFDGEHNTPYTRVKREMPVSLVATYDDANTVINVFYDGIERTYGTMYNNWNRGDSRIVLGDRSVESPSYIWWGEIYSIRLYDRALTSAEIARNNLIDVKRFYTSAIYDKTGMVSFWDALDNVGEGMHSSTTNIWKNLVENHEDIKLNNSAWSDNALVCTGGTKSGAYGTNTLEYNSLEVLYRNEQPDVALNAWLFSNGINRYCVLGYHRLQWQNYCGVQSSGDWYLSREYGGIHATGWVNPGPGAITNAYIDGERTIYEWRPSQARDGELDDWGVGGSYVQVGGRSDGGQNFKGRIYSVRAYSSSLDFKKIRENCQIDMMRYTNPMWWNGADGTFGTPGSWTDVDPTQVIPNADNTVVLSDGTYTVQLDTDRTVAALWANNGNVLRTSRLDTTLDLGGHTLMVHGDCRAESTWGMGNRFSRLALTNGTFKANAVQIGAIHDTIFCEPNIVAQDVAFKAGSGTFVVEGPGTDVNIRKEFRMVGPFTHLRVAGGASFSCGRLRTYSMKYRDSTYPSDAYDRALIEFTGPGTRGSLGSTWIHRDVDIFITDGASVTVRGSSELFAVLNYWCSNIGRSCESYYGNSTRMVIDNATLQLRSNGFVVGASYKGNGGEGTTLTLRNGATLAVTNVYRFVVGSARNESKYNCMNCALDVLDGSSFVGGSNTKLEVGASGNASFCGVNVSNSTARCNVLYVGTKQSATCSSNDFLHVAGVAARVDVLSTTVDSIRLRTGARLKFTLPPDGFTTTPLMTAGGVSVVADEASYAVDPVTLEIDASAFDPDLRGRRQTLLTCATASTASLERLADNLTFVNTPTRKRGQVFVEDNGTKLVYKGPSDGTVIVVQ